MGKTRRNGITDHSPILKRGGSTGSEVTIIVNGYPYYVKQVDANHLKMSTKEENLDKVVEYHIDHYKELPYYEDLKRWLQGENLRMNTKYNHEFQFGGNIPDPVDATHEEGGQLDAVSDMLPSASESAIDQPNMDIIEPINVLDTITPMENGGEALAVTKFAVLRDLLREYARNKYGENFDQTTFTTFREGVGGKTESGKTIEISYDDLFATSYSDGGQLTAPEKFRMVMGEYKDGKLKSGSGDVVTDKDQAFAIAYSEARKINKGFGRYEAGGGILDYHFADEEIMLNNKLIAIKSLDTSIDTVNELRNQVQSDLSSIDLATKESLRNIEKIAINERTNELKLKYSNNPEELVKKLEDLHRGSYDYIVDPDNRYKGVDFSSLSDSSISEFIETLILKSPVVLNNSINPEIKERAKRWDSAYKNAEIQKALLSVLGVSPESYIQAKAKILDRLSEIKQENSQKELQEKNNIKAMNTEPKDFPIKGTNTFKYSITYHVIDKNNPEKGNYSDEGFIVQNDIAKIADILCQSHFDHGIHSPVGIGSWESTEPINGNYYILHLTNKLGDSITQEEHDFITALLNNGYLKDGEIWGNHKTVKNFNLGGIVISGLLGGFLGYRLGKSSPFRDTDRYDDGGAVLTLQDSSRKLAQNPIIESNVSVGNFVRYNDEIWYLKKINYITGRVTLIRPFDNKMKILKRKEAEGLEIIRSLGGQLNEGDREVYNKLVGRIGNDYYFVDNIFKHADDFMGAVATVVSPVKREYYDWATSREGLEERFYDAMSEEEWADAIYIDIDDYSSEDELKEAILDGIENQYDAGQLEVFEEAYEQEDQMRALGMFEDEFPVFEVVGGGRSFSDDQEFDEIYDQELLDRVFLAEGKKLRNGGSLKSSKKDSPKYKVGDEVYYLPKLSGFDNSQPLIVEYVNFREYDELERGLGLSDDPHYYYSFKDSNLGAIEDHLSSTKPEFKKGGEIELPNTNLQLVGHGRDTNGNRIVKVQLPNERAFSIQTNGNLPQTHSILTGIKIKDLNDDQILIIEKEVSDYIQEYGSKKQKDKLKLYYSNGGSVKSNKKRAPKYDIGEEVYSYLNPDTKFEINKRRDNGVDGNIDYGYAYIIALKDNDGYSYSSKWINENSISKTSKESDLKRLANGKMSEFDLREKWGSVYAQGGETNPNYRLLSRMQADNEYFLGNDGKTRSERHLYMGNVDDQISEMKNIWNSFPENEKPEWLSMEDILEYEAKMKENHNDNENIYSKGGETQQDIPALFDELKKGDTILMTYGSSIRKDNEVKLIVTRKGIVGKGKPYESEKITFIREDNPTGVKYYAYKRKNGYVGFSIGDMAISNINILEINDKKYSDGGELKRLSEEYDLQTALYMDKFDGDHKNPEAIEMNKKIKEIEKKMNDLRHSDDTSYKYGGRSYSNGGEINKIQEKLNDKTVSFSEFYNYLQDKDIGYWDEINSEEIIKEYLYEKEAEGIEVSHIREAIENNPSQEGLYSIWLGNSMETPEPINTKRDLYDALELDEDDTSYKYGGRVTKNSDVVERFLSSSDEVKTKNLSTHYNEFDDEVLLRNYGTLIATRKGNEVKISSKKYSQTTSTIQNMVEREAESKGLNVSRVDKFEDGGEIRSKYDTYTKLVNPQGKIDKLTFNYRETPTKSDILKDLKYFSTKSGGSFIPSIIVSYLFVDKQDAGHRVVVFNESSVKDYQKELQEGFYDEVRDTRKVYYLKPSEIMQTGGEVLSDEGNYIKISATKDKLVITPYEDTIEYIRELKEDGYSDIEIMSELFEDISANSELLWHNDLGEQGFGLTSASGVTDGYYYGDDGDFTDQGRSDARVYYFNDYMIRSEVDDLIDRGQLILTGADNKYEFGGEMRLNPQQKKSVRTIVFDLDGSDNERRDSEIRKKLGTKYYSAGIRYANSILSNGGLIEDIFDSTVDFGDKEEWMVEAVRELRDHEDIPELKVVRIESSDHIYVEHHQEYMVFEDEDAAREFAIEQVRNDLDENPEYFTQSWLLDFIDNEKAENFFRQMYNEWDTNYATDIMMEEGDTYENRLVDEMVERGLMTDEEAESEEASEIADDRIDTFVESIVDERIEEGNGGYDSFEGDFGKEEAQALLIKHNLLDIDAASEDAVRVDGIGHFLSGYDGEQIDLPSNAVAYRTN